MNSFKIGQKVHVKANPHSFVSSHAKETGIVQQVEGPFCIVKFKTGETKIHIFDLEAV